MKIQMCQLEDAKLFSSYYQMNASHLEKWEPIREKDYHSIPSWEERLFVIDYAFKELGLNRIMANYMPNNERSAKLLESLGFIKEGFAKRYLFINGKWEDHVLTSLLSKNDI